MKQQALFCWLYTDFRARAGVIEVYDLGTGQWNSLAFPFNNDVTSLTSIDDLLVHRTVS